MMLTSPWRRGLAGLGVLIWPIAFLAAARIALAARFPPNHALVGDWYNHASYFGVFLLGFALAGTHAPWEALQRFRWHTLGAAILGWSSLCAYFGIYSADTVPPKEGLLLVMTTAAACFLAYEVIRRVRPLQPLFGAGREANVRNESRAADELRTPAGSF